MTARPKEGTFRSEAWRRAVSTLDCVFCGAPGPSQAAHINMGKGMGWKTHDCWCAAACPNCHAELDQGMKLSRAERRQTMELGVLLTIAELAKKGLIKC